MTMGSQAYGEAWYWDNRYKKEKAPFEWYQNYSSLSPLFHSYLPRHRRILVAGCGNSPFSEGMANDGYEDIVNVDISAVVIEAMKKKYRNFPQMKYIKMDVRDMCAFATSSFDAVIDKGTLDSLLCGNNSGQNAAKMLEEVRRVLKDKGMYILITYGAPSYRLYLLREACMRNIKLHVIGSVDDTGKQVWESRSEEGKWELTKPVPIDEDGTSIEAALGKNPDVHYIYVCAEDASLSENTT